MSALAILLIVVAVVVLVAIAVVALLRKRRAGRVLLASRPSTRSRKVRR